MESIEKLREFAETPPHVFREELIELADEIEREIAEKYMELPVDADGVPWHIGDVTENGNTVNAITFDRFGAHFTSTLNDIDPSIHTHAKPRTVEDVLHDFWEEWQEAYVNITWSDALKRLRELEGKYAAELRMRDE
jgi:hypothetical protein